MYRISPNYSELSHLPSPKRERERERESALLSGDHQFLINVYQKAVHRKRLCRLLVFRLSPHSSFASGAIIALSEGSFPVAAEETGGRGGVLELNIQKHHLHCKH
ncbi:hypothetical protein CEXT_48811 [Caerostris extrusa]|uniref:Uncharacterized protein n=1 Tax=Caerostris extrusa TaxID=172846 RepID=A0AAV4SXW4_CAEEX|nr:hypothetical protein CEXT_48811 [Caerostris extrusa]